MKETRSQNNRQKWHSVTCCTTRPDIHLLRKAECIPRTRSIITQTWETDVSVMQMSAAQSFRQIWRAYSRNSIRYTILVPAEQIVKLLTPVANADLWRTDLRTDMKCTDLENSKLRCKVTTTDMGNVNGTMTFIKLLRDKFGKNIRRLFRWIYLIEDYLIMVSRALIVYHPTKRWLTNNELQRTWKQEWNNFK